MARSRNIKPSLFKNELLGCADPLLTILFESLWCLADREGRLEDRPLRINAETFPYRNVPLPLFNGYLTELQRLGFIVRYKAGDLPLIQVVNFKKHQTPHNTEKASELPAPQDVPILALDNGELTQAKRSDSLNLIPDSLNLIPEEERAPFGGCPPDLLPWLEWWNGLRAEGLTSSGVETSPPSKAILKAWARVQRTKELREMFCDRSRIEKAIRESDFVIRAQWFRLERLLGGCNRDGEFIIRKLLDGGYSDTNGKPSPKRQGAGVHYDPNASTDDKF